MGSVIHIRGAREHNLTNLSLELPRDKLVVITGPSGSGKSSLAFDTLYAEGRRRYVESLSAYARQFLGMMKKPDVDAIEGLSPAISIEQKTTSKNPRSTVATLTEIYDYLRLLYARVGTPYSPATGKPIEAQTVPQMVHTLLELPPGRLVVLAPFVRGRKGEFRKEFVDLQKRGFVRAEVNGELCELDSPPLLDKQKKHTINVLVDRLRLQPDSEGKADFRQRLTEALELALRTSSEELVLVQHTPEEGQSTELLLSSRFACPESGFQLAKLEPRLFSFNSPFGACLACDGLGVAVEVDEDKVVPDSSLSLEDGAIAPFSGGFFSYYLQTLTAVADHYGFSVRVPFADLDDEAKKVLLHGSGRQAIASVIQDQKRTFRSNKPFEGVIPMLKRRHKEREKAEAGTAEDDRLGRWYKMDVCQVCEGTRLNPEARCVKLHGQSIADVVALSVTAAHSWFKGLSQYLSKNQLKIAQPILKEIIERVGFLNEVGVGYLTLSRAAGTLSGGEAQRIRLASQIGAGLVGVLYVLDEPSIGLHQRDNARLIGTLGRLRDLGNTVVVVEHDEDTMRAADYLVDMGPGAGVHGGHIVAAGTVDQVMQHEKSLTGAYLSGKKSIVVPTKRRPRNEGKTLSITGASSHNLQNVNVEIPLGLFVCVTGVSGSGKSSLVHHTLSKALAKQLYRAKADPGPYKNLEGLAHLDKMVEIDQSPIGRTPRSNPATYTGLFGPIRDWFTGLPLARTRGYQPGRFSFNVRGGRCEACCGDGVTKVEMHFLPDVYVTCDVCGGKRYNRETLDVKFKDKSIADVLDMTVDEAAVFFEAMPALRDRLTMLQDVGLGYIHVGQRATTLSGGEAQRVKLSKELARRATGRTLYILDEPTTGLHVDDVKKLLEVLHRLVDKGNSVLVIEHNLDVIKTADWLIDMGPEGGSGGGRVLAAGTPEEVAACAASHTGTFLQKML